MHLQPEGSAARLLATLMLAALVGCAGPVRKAPVEDRRPIAKPVVEVPPPAPVTEAPKPLPGAENVGRPDYYTVKPGDTLLRISLDHGLNWRDIVRWNNLENPNVLEVGEVLRVAPPTTEVAAATARAVPGAGRVESRPLDGRPALPGAAGAAASAPISAVPAGAAPAPASPPAATGNVVAASPPPTSAAAPRDAGEDVLWAWPASGTVVSGFDEGRSKGLTIAGKAGDPVFAAGDGRVVYAGSSLRGYGNLVIVKHNDTYLTAYAHNQVLLVKDDQVVRRGQKIAEMGSTDAERVQLHFEIRRQGKPVDPAKLLPAR